MADRLAVDGGELEHFMKLLKKSSDSLKGLRKALSDATVTGLGTDDLDSACEDFQEDWKCGTEEIGKQTEDLAKIIGQSKDSYEEVDRPGVQRGRRTGESRRWKSSSSPSQRSSWRAALRMECAAFFKLRAS